MMHSMNTIGMDGGFGFTFLWLVHVLSVILFFSGLVFLIVWAIKTLPAAHLKNWALGLLIGGTVLCLLSVATLGRPWVGGGMNGGFGVSRGSMMMGGGGMMMTRSGDKDDYMGMMRGGGMGMMSSMGMMLEGLEGDEFDEAFIRMMIPHHEGAIDMAEEALESSNHEEMKQLARDIIDAQQREIDMMKGWLTTWGFEN